MPVAKAFSVLTAVLLATTACDIAKAGDRPERGTPPVSPAESPRPYDPESDAGAEIGTALAKAKTDGRPVLLDFGARWCPECAALHRILHQDPARHLLDGYHRVTIDVGRLDRNLGLARDYGLDIKRTGIPALVVLSAQGRVRAAGNKELYPAGARDLTPENVAAFLRRWT